MSENYQMNNSNSTDFGFEQVAVEDKIRRVAEVFSSVSLSYDLMNDQMSFGVHRLWKRFAVHMSGVRQGYKVLDIAGGTGDMALLFHQKVSDEGSVLITDINNDMLQQGRNKLIDKGILK